MYYKSPSNFCKVCLDKEFILSQISHLYIDESQEKHYPTDLTHFYKLLLQNFFPKFQLYKNTRDCASIYKYRFFFVSSIDLNCLLEKLLFVNKRTP